MSERLTKKDFSIIKRAKSFAHAGRGIVLFFKSTPNAWIQLFALALVVYLGLRFSITTTEWLFLILVSGMVLVSEAFNTAIEIDIDLTSPEYHPHARDTKDVAAGAVLLSSCTAVAVGVCIFLPYMF
jgi:diacylglycerol kinase